MKILLGMSGGLDSSFAAEILKAEGHNVEGAVLKMHGYTDIDGAEKAASDAGVRLHVIDCSEAFERNVIEYFVREYALGRTPNPCTVCNRTVKIAELLRYAEENGFDKVATGHYARIGFENGRYYVADGADKAKNQSYMLWGLSQEQIKRLEFPLGDRIKGDVRESARALGLPSADSPESQDVCFLPDGGYAEFIEKRLGVFPEGNFIDESGNVLGRHKGVIHYTVGQRRGLGIALGERMFVSGIDPKKNTVTLCAAGGRGFTSAVLTDMNHQLLPEGDGKHAVNVKIRYAARPVPATLTVSGERATVEFVSPISAVTPGQSAVMYDGDGRILCGGVIESATS